MFVQTVAMLALAAAGAHQSPSPDRASAIPFAPFQVRVTLDLASGVRTSNCRVATQGEPHAFWVDDPCGNLARPGFLQAVGVDERAEGRMTVLLWLETGTGAVGSTSAPGGLVSSRALSFELRADGTVSECVNEQGVGGMDLDLCPALPRPPRPFVSAPAGTVRQGRLQLSFHLDR